MAWRGAVFGVAGDYRYRAVRPGRRFVAGRTPFRCPFPALVAALLGLNDELIGLVEVDVSGRHLAAGVMSSGSGKTYRHLLRCFAPRQLLGGNHPVCAIAGLAILLGITCHRLRRVLLTVQLVSI